MIRAIVVDDHPVFRLGLRTQLTQLPQCQVVGEAHTVAEALQLTKRHDLNLALVDITLPDGSGLDLTREIKRLRPDAAVLIISMHNHIDLVAAAFQAGASGYMSKESGGTGILQAVEKVLSGSQYLDGTLSPAILGAIQAKNRRQHATSAEAYNSLSLREQQIMRLLAQGLSPEEIASKLYISKKTVLNHRYSIMQKLGTPTPLAFMRYAARLGIIDLEDED
jgi:DNA-binding NarL/FixJ family response regulator